MISTPIENGTTSEWVEESWDVLGRPTKVTDASGLEYRIEYDREGRVSTYGRVAEDGQLLGANVGYDDEGRVVAVRSSWGSERRSYSAEGVLRTLETVRGDARHLSHFDSRGRPADVSRFDGGRLLWHYSRGRAGGTLVGIDLPNQQSIRYVVRGEQGGPSVSTATMGPAEVVYSTGAGGRVTRFTWGGVR